MIDLKKMPTKKLIEYHKELHDSIYGINSNYRVKDLIFLDQMRKELTDRGCEMYEKIDWKEKIDGE